MRVLKGIIAFCVVFSILAVTIVCSAVVCDTAPLSAFSLNVPVSADIEASLETGSFVPNLSVEGATSFTPRTTAPTKKNKYYYSDINIFYKSGWGMPNCTAYAWGRAYEILKTEPQLCIYSAYQWYDYNKKNKIYKYGKTPKLGAIACWKYSDGTSGHVAVVEKITSSKIYYSNSAWNGEEFYVHTSPIDDPSDGKKTWIFQGFIYIGDFVAPESDEQEQGDVYKITSDDGVNLRKGAGTSYSVVSAIPYNAQVTVTKKKKSDD